ncbi:S41 family peptidase [Shewanella amazonensis]|uniref:Tail specific protease domain-containing protein n=1 Tax=Shewanella amazonensis (strain ATCC BAA-1098 / SB2B) TaxID=326297 RepID=A1S9P0_SHEAM|nr:S41 family peptidase [Shewanella amazonensis]ABM01097.1 conserved hypothetical protein [Shewanella amazonensis SB2B]
MKASSAGQPTATPPTFDAVLAVLVIIITVSAMRLSLFLWPQEPRADTLTAREMRQDLYILQREIAAHSAFLSLEPDIKQQRIDSYIRAMSNRYPDQIPSHLFAAEVLKILNLLDDPGVATEADAEFGQRLPVQLRPMEDSWLALNESLTPFDENYPFISHLDDIPMARWQEAAQAFLPASSKYSLTEQATWLERTSLLRGELGLVQKSEVTLTLTNPEGQQRRTSLTLLPPAPDPSVIATPFAIQPMADRGFWVTIGDLNELEQNRAMMQELKRAMAAKLLVLDLRRTQGQSPALLTVLGAYADEDSTMLGYARYRTSVDKRNDYLGSRAYHAVSEGPQLVEDEAHSRFGQWYARSQPKAEKVSGRLALIAGPGCRQECEWIVHSAKGWQRAIIIGEDTMGDLGKLHVFQLPNLKQRFYFSSSLAYALDGSLISGAGTSPDIWVPGQESFDAEGILALIGELAPVDTKTPAEPSPAEPSEQGQQENVQQENVQQENPLQEDADEKSQSQRIQGEPIHDGSGGNTALATPETHVKTTESPTPQISPTP